MPDRLLIRCDGSTRFGTGHVMRCLALAQGWQRAGGQAVFVQAQSTPALVQRLRDEGMEVIRLDTERGTAGDAAQTVQLAREHEAEWIVADGYVFGGAWQKQIKDAELRLLVWDDYGHSERYYSDFILNQNLHADGNLYARREPYTRLLLGPRYAQLRREFLQWRGWQREIPSVAHKILVTLGGSDPDNFTGKVIEALHGLDLEAKIVAGGSNPHLDSLQSSISHLRSSVRLVRDVTNMPELMAWADVAVAAAGSTSWELAYMGLPSLVLALAYNQRRILEALDVARMVQPTTPDRLAIELRALLSDADQRQVLSRRAQLLVDGLGSERVVLKLKQHLASELRAC